MYTTYSIVIATFLGTMGLPHVVVRFYTNPDGRAARRTTLVVLALLGVFYVLPPVYGALGRMYAGDLVANHPAIEPTRHAYYYRLNARNRVWLAKRNLPWILVPFYVGSWTGIQVLRWARRPEARASYHSSAAISRAACTILRAAAPRSSGSKKCVRAAIAGPADQRRRYRAQSRRGNRHRFAGRNHPARTIPSDRRRRNCLQAFATNRRQKM
jgi:hypothetical protein